MARATKTFNLFVYGTFMDRRLFRWVTGHDYTLTGKPDDQVHILKGREAILASHQKISPDGMYFYALPRKRHRIGGYLIYNLPEELLELLDHYEGKRYRRAKVTVHQDAHRIRAHTYLANEEALRQDFGDRFRVNPKHEHVITKRVEEFLEYRAADLAEPELPAHYRVMAEEELRGLTIRDLIRARLESSTVADYFLKRELSQPLASIAKLLAQPEAKRFIKNYLSLLVRQVLVNQTEEKFREQFRFDLDHLGQSPRFYEHTVSSVAALRMLNDQREPLEKLLGQLVRDFDAKRHDLLDIVAWAIQAAESLYADRSANVVFNWLRENIDGGFLPMGVELEFSNVGHSVVADYDTGPGTRDDVFDGFRYFGDFALPALTWKLGGHLDDHQAHDTRDCLRGFLEFSPGALSIEPKLSVPATNNPWLLGQLIRQMVRFYPVKPHSLHLSIQLLRRNIERKGILPLDFAKCLLVLGGDPRPDPNSKLIISRIVNNEIGSPSHKDGLVFARLSRRRATAEDRDEEPTVLRPARPTATQQFKFMRLSDKINYEILILSLKGLQLALNLGDYLTPEQIKADPHLAGELDELFAWSAQPEPIKPKLVGRFCATVFEGLSKERHGKLAHSNTYVQWALDRISNQIAEFNKKLED